MPSAPDPGRRDGQGALQQQALGLCGVGDRKRERRKALRGVAAWGAHIEAHIGKLEGGLGRAPAEQDLIVSYGRVGR